MCSSDLILTFLQNPHHLIAEHAIQRLDLFQWVSTRCLFSISILLEEQYVLLIQCFGDSVVWFYFCLSEARLEHVRQSVHLSPPTHKLALIYD